MRVSYDIGIYSRYFVAFKSALGTLRRSRRGPLPGRCRYSVQAVALDAALIAAYINDSKVSY